MKVLLGGLVGAAARHEGRGGTADRRQILPARLEQGSAQAPDGLAQLELFWRERVGRSTGIRFFKFVWHFQQ
jgi:hypothetical protein